MNIRAQRFLRPAMKNGQMEPVGFWEDGFTINSTAKVYLVTDGVSAPFSPGYPRWLDAHGNSGGRIISQIVCDVFRRAKPGDQLDHLLMYASGRAAAWQESCGMDFRKEAVAGAGFAACKIDDGFVDFIFAADCWVFWCDGSGWHCRYNLDPVAERKEAEGDRIFSSCAKKALEIGRHPWDVYLEEHFFKQQFDRANRNRGKGGHGVFNGNPDLCRYWSRLQLPLSGLHNIVLCTDGLVPKQLAFHKHYARLATEFGQHYEKGGMKAVVKWYDRFEKEPHIGQKNHPEGTAVMITLSA